MSANLPNNPYAEYAQTHMDPALATLALAYEIRTANLINFAYTDANEIIERLKDEA